MLTINDKLAGEDLLLLQHEKGNICISIIVPTHRLSSERRVDKLEVERAIDKATQLLYYKYPEQEIMPLLKTMDELYKSIDFNHNAEGLGLYISNNVKLLAQFPFPVEEKVMVGDNFEWRDLVYKMDYGETYYVLLLSEKGAGLFEGSWNELKDIRDKNFPKKFEEQFSYNPPSQSTSYGGYAHVKSFEKDKSEIEEIRFKDFFREVDKALNDYMGNNISFVLLGPEKELAWFEKISVHKKRIIDKIAGNYNHQNLKQLADIAWPAMLAHLQQQREQLVNEFREKIGEHLGISGIQEVWDAAAEGKGLKLIVEKDYRSPGFIADSDYHLYLRPPQKKHKALPDAVDDLIEMVIGKNGHVYFTDNDKLKDYQHIALITRY